MDTFLLFVAAIQQAAMWLECECKSIKKQTYNRDNQVHVSIYVYKYKFPILIE